MCHKLHIFGRITLVDNTVMMEANSRKGKKKLFRGSFFRSGVSRELTPCNAKTVFYSHSSFLSFTIRKFVAEKYCTAHVLGHVQATF